MTLKNLRQQYNLTQLVAAQLLGVPERTLRRYEEDDNYGSEIKRNFFIEKLKEECEITEEKGLLSVEEITQKVRQLFDSQYKDKVDFCILFGSYAKGTANPKSDVDLYICSSLTGLRFVGLIEKLRQTLHKKIDLIRSSEIENNVELVNEIMKDGIKIYG